MGKIKAEGLKATEKKNEIEFGELVKEVNRELGGLTSSSTWKCYRCSLIFHEEWLASLHKEISNHLSRMLESNRF